MFGRDRHPHPGGAPGATPDGQPEQAAAVASDAGLVCAQCGHLVTHPRHRLSVQGSHQHRFMNPGGFLYDIGCFAEAVGCVLVGPASREYPWFVGYAWRCAHCGGCGQQLGWHFRAFDAASGGFFGLILERLREAEGPAAPGN